MAQQSPTDKPGALLEIEERDQANNLVATYVTSPHDGGKSSSRIDVIIPKNSNSYAREVLNAFLPAGYPHSVTKDYLEYQIYDSLQAFSSSIAGLLSSRAVLEGLKTSTHFNKICYDFINRQYMIHQTSFSLELTSRDEYIARIGVGDSHASPTSALLLSVLQDSMGRIATILFAHRMGTSLEPECKMYRLAADVFNDSAMILDCLSPLLPKAWRVFLLSFSSVLRALCGVAAGSSKASLSAHFATQGNLGELNAKDSSQETIISLAGMLAGTLVVSRISSLWATWTALIMLLAIHLGTNYRAVKAVSMRTLNRQRANLLFSHWLEQVDGSRAASENNRHPPTKVLSPDEVSAQERVFERDGVLRWKGKEILGYCRLGVELKCILGLLSRSHQTTGSYKEIQSQQVATLLDIYKDDGYILWYDQPRKTFLIVLKDDAGATDQLKAWMQALYFAKQTAQTPDVETLVQALGRTHQYVTKSITEFSFFNELEMARWDLKTGAMETRSGTRIRIQGSKRANGESQTPGNGT